MTKNKWPKSDEKSGFGGTLGLPWGTLVSTGKLSTHNRFHKTPPLQPNTAQSLLTSQAQYRPVSADITSPIPLSLCWHHQPNTAQSLLKSLAQCRPVSAEVPSSIPSSLCWHHCPHYRSVSAEITSSIPLSLCWNHQPNTVQSLLTSPAQYRCLCWHH